jgi:regulatory protein
MKKNRVGKEQAILCIRHFCAYQERAQQEVRDKLYELGMTKPEVEEILSDLISENFLNEERFAIHFAGGKFRIKQWGRIKIKYELKKKNVSDYCIKKALAAINMSDYFATVSKLADIKFKSLKSEKNIFVKKTKLHSHLRLKGFESNLIQEVMNDLIK